MSINLGISEKAWKTTTETPIFKAWNSLELHNYRPNSIPSVMPKVIKRHVTEQLSTHSFR